MNKKQIIDFLNKKEIWFELTEHEAVFSMDEIDNIEMPYPESEAKNLFLTDGKKKSYYLISVKGNKRINLKEFKRQNNACHLSFASENDLDEILQLKPGSVTPLGILNDNNCKVKVYLDKEFLELPRLIGVHPNDNTATVWLKIDDLINIIKEHGNKFELVDIPVS